MVQMVELAAAVDEDAGGEDEAMLFSGGEHDDEALWRSSLVQSESWQLLVIIGEGW